MTPKKLKALGFKPSSKRVRIGEELVQFWNWQDGSQFTVTWKPVFVLAPHELGEFGGEYTEADLNENGWPQARFAAMQQSLF